MARVEVTVSINVEGLEGMNPASLTWRRSFTKGDNPRFYGDALRDAMRVTNAAVMGGLSYYPPADEPSAGPDMAQVFARERDVEP